MFKRVDIKTLKLNVNAKSLQRIDRDLAGKIWRNHMRGNIPIRVRGRDVIDGNKRVLAAIHMGFTWVEAEVEDVLEAA